MHRINTPRVALVLSVLALGSCGDRDVEAHQSVPGTVAAAPSRADEPRAVAGGSTDRFELTLDGPPFAGTHQVSGDMGCMMFNGVWQAVYESVDDPGLSGMLVQLKEVPASGGSTDNLTLSVTFGQMDDMSGNAGIVDVHGAEFGRDGRGSVTREGDGAVLRIEGTSEHGARVTAVLRCASVELMR